jgi:hypothetical protein
MLDELKGVLVGLGVLVLLLALVVRVSSRWLLRLLLSRHEWMTTRKTASWHVSVWSLCVGLLLGSSKKTYDFEGCLPALPVPRLTSTVDKVWDCECAAH